ncbi:restriction endonuclease [Pseudoduganella namucuonensis]|uniref:restriction endonuclease n=1 Tax=Pseudoduganella namucuonensis TaxID=1035707 RepID=UPI0015A7037A|nr:restriction endonuclease [Pseudoduganella namucuonensis]
MKRESMNGSHTGQWQSGHRGDGRTSRRPVGWDAAWAARFRRWGAALSKLATRCFSRWLNAGRISCLPGHQRNVRQSRRVLRAVRGFTAQGVGARSLAYLRAVDPLVFEEVVMSALEDAGLLVLRSRRYSGDGGVDGAVWLPGGGWHAVQSKRYRHHVCTAHVCAFGEAIASGGYDGGLFVHTGRSGAGLYPKLDADHIGLLSGERLLRLVRYRALEYRVGDGKRNVFR